MTRNPLNIAVVGAGVAGATCAQSLAEAGHRVQVFDKSRGPGGRLATRRLAWVDQSGAAQMTRLDHGAPGFAARTSAFRAFVEQAVHAGWLGDWAPVLAPGSLPLDGGGPFYVPLPDMPSLCRRLLDGVEVSASFAVERLVQGSQGWQLQADDGRLSNAFDAVLLALPPAQAAPLLGPHRDDWARHACVAPMQPCWTLMGVAHTPDEAALVPPGWDLGRPRTGPLAWVMRNDARPSRIGVAGQAHWVLHASPGFSRRHLDRPAAWVQQRMQSALADWLGRPLSWQHVVVHRWRYAMAPPAAHPQASTNPCWCDAAQGLGVCGDFLGGSGVEGAWLSGQALASALLQGRSNEAWVSAAPAGPAATAAPGPSSRLVA